jgi:outer membrane protein OmpA-like peptidoglycan-associated protein
MKIRTVFFFSLFITFIFLQSCASSNITREANDNVAVGYQNTKSSFEGLADSNIADSYDNLSETSKGLILGGTVGAVGGSLTSGVGLVPGLAIGAIFGGAYGAYIDSNTTLLDKLQNRGVKVIVLGDQILIVLRSNHVFNGMTPTIQPGEYATLDLVAKFLNNYTTMGVRVAGYTDDSGSERINRSLSKEQAESIVRYLWRSGVNTRMLTAAGMGGTHLVSSNSTDWRASDNYRIEITTEKLPTTGTLG